MKFSLAIIIIVALVCIISYTYIFQAGYANNLLLNPNFEEGLSGWSTYEGNLSLVE